jgi:hypothetical protein
MQAELFLKSFPTVRLVVVWTRPALDLPAAWHQAPWPSSQLDQSTSIQRFIGAGPADTFVFLGKLERDSLTID